MSNEQREHTNRFAEWIFRIGIGVVGALALIAFTDMKESIKDVGDDVKTVSSEVRRDIKNVNDRLIRVETKIENR
jgi:IS4 transposase